MIGEGNRPIDVLWRLRRRLRRDHRISVTHVEVHPETRHEMLREFIDLGLVIGDPTIFGVRIVGNEDIPKGDVMLSGASLEPVEPARPTWTTPTIAAPGPSWPPPRRLSPEPFRWGDSQVIDSDAVRRQMDEIDRIIEGAT